MKKGHVKRLDAGVNPAQSQGGYLAGLTFFQKSFSIKSIQKYMLADNGKPDSWRKSLKLISQCPVCNCDYESEAIKLFATGSEAKFVHFTCRKCRTHFVAMIITMAKGVSTVGMITDLNFQDMQKLYNTSPLTIDEMIEGRQFINSSDFNTAIKRKFN